jgi:hypothetical protein
MKLTAPEGQFLLLQILYLQRALFKFYKKKIIYKQSLLVK